MIGRVLLAAILAGLAAGFIMGVIQHVRLTPLILEAEKYEHVAHGHGAANEAGTPQVDEHSNGDEVWSPANGWERATYTLLTAMLVGAGFSLMLAGVSILSGLSITPANGLLWGLCAFLAVSLAPAIGLPPELPGMPVAGLIARQGWWIGTIICTALATWLVVVQSTKLALAGAAVLALLPHVLGAPKPPPEPSALPPALAAEFATASIGANLVSWLLIGFLLSLALSRFEGRPQS